MRVPYAAKTLHAQVSAKYKSSKMTPVGDPDGLGVTRTVQFGKTESKWLGELLEHLGDPRIESFKSTKDGLRVTFAAHRRADERTDFDLADAETVSQSAPRTPADDA